MVDDGLDDQEARDRIFILDSKGLVFDGRHDLSAVKQAVALRSSQTADWPGNGPWDLLTVVTRVRATALVGVSGQAGAFSQGVITAVAEGAERPVILPLSNPTSHAEATPEDIIGWTDGAALVATGSPFPPVVHRDEVHRIGQANNVFIFPGMGLGTLASRASRVTDGMFLAAAKTLAACLPDAALQDGALFPSIEQVRPVSRAIATAVFAQAVSEGVAEDVPSIEEAIADELWEPEYVPLRAI